MAILAVSLAGAALGDAIGGAGIATSLGWLAGNVLGTLLFSPKAPNTTQEGPRLGDLTVTSSAYGAPIPYGYGTARMAGNIIWSTGIKETKTVTTQRVSGGKGGGKSSTATTITYTYSCSFTVALCEGPAAGVLRIWGDSKLIYDATSATVLPDAVAGMVFRFYAGDEDQLPDGLEVADKGDGNVPGYRGIARIVFDDLQLANFGNRIPNITVEVAFADTTPQYPVVVWTPITSPNAQRITQEGVVGIDYDRQIVYTMATTLTTGNNALRRMQYANLIEDRVVLDSAVLPSDPADFPSLSNLFVGDDGFLYGNSAGGNSKSIVKIDPNSMTQVDIWGGTGSGTSNTEGSFTATTQFGMVTSYTQSGKQYSLVCGGFFGSIGVISTDPMGYLYGAGAELDEARCIGIVQGDVTQEFGTAYVIGGGFQSGSGESANMGIYKVTVETGAAFISLLGTTTGVTFEKLATLAASDLIPGATTLTDGQLIGRDATDGGLVIQTSDTNHTEYVIFKWREGDGIVWKNVVANGINQITASFASNNRLNGQYYFWLGGVNQGYRIDLRTGTYTELGTIPTIASGGFGTQQFDGASNSILFRNGTDGGGSGNNFWKRVFMGRAQPNGEPLGDIITDLCVRAGLSPADIDVSELTDLVLGFIVSSPTSGRDAMTPLSQAYFFDGVETDYILKFPKRGGSPSFTATNDDLGFIDEDSGTTWTETRAQEVELPGRVDVLYMDVDNDYQQGTQSAKRIVGIIPQMQAGDATQLQLPLVMTADTAKQIAEKQLFTAWTERSAYEGIFSWKFLLLDPADIMDMTLADGSTFRVRAMKAQLGADLSLDINFVAQDAASYSSTATGNGGSGLLPQKIPGSGFTKLFLLDVPLLRDFDDTKGISSETYYFMGGYGTGSWPGANLYKSQDNASFSTVGQDLVECSWGVAVNALGDPAMVFATDEDNTLTVFMNTGKDHLESVSQLDMLNGANAALLLRSDNTPEIIQYRDVAENDDGSFTLSGLLRGRRGTDVYAFGHSPGEGFLLLEPDAAEAFQLALSELNQTRYYKGVGFNTLLEDAELEVRSNTGRDLKPYAPWHYRGHVDTAGNIDLAWNRRTRLNGALIDGVGTVPLNEVTEAYQVDIKTGPAGTVLRTLEATTTAISYPHAQVLTDFGSIPTHLTLNVYQMSDAVGRGFSWEFTIELT